MQLENFIKELENNVDPAYYHAKNDRRQTLRQIGRMSGKMALAALPVALSGLFEKASAAPSTTTVLDVLNFALTLEYLEAGFYAMGLSKASTLIPHAEDLTALTIIGKHEAEHVAFLTGAIKSLGGTPVALPKFDYTAGAGSGNGPFKGLFDNYDVFLAVAQTFEDTGVRAYKGQAPALVGGGALLTYALDIHSVEARHASRIRKLRNSRGATDVKPWITLNESGIPGAAGAIVAPSYAGEDNTIQGGVQTVNLNGYNFSAATASEAFDEPLTMMQVLAIVKPFFA